MWRVGRLERVHDVVRARPALSVSRTHAAPVGRTLQELRGRHLQLLRRVPEHYDNPSTGDDDAKPDAKHNYADDDDAEPNAKPDVEPDGAGDDTAAGRCGVRGVGSVERLQGEMRRRDRAALPVSRAHAASVECRMSELRARGVRNRSVRCYNDDTTDAKSDNRRR